MGRVRKPLVQVSRIRRSYMHGGHTPHRFIIHSTESGDARGLSDLTNIDHFWTNVQRRGYGAHVVIDSAGNSMQCAYSSQVVWATYMANTGSIQYELVGRAGWSAQVWRGRVAQLNKLAKWIAWHAKVHSIPISRTTVRMHRDFPGTHWDPGPGFARLALVYVIARARYYRSNGW